MNIGGKRTQYLILATLAGCGLFFLALYFLILPSIRSWKEDSAKTKEIQNKLSEMRAVVQSRPIIQNQIETAKSVVKTFAVNIPLPVLGNYLLGMEEKLRQCAGNAGINVANIADNDIIEISPENSKFKIYRVRAQVKSGFQDFIRLADGIHGSNPLVSISGINIITRDDSPAAHEISFVVSWFIWAAPAGRPAFLMEEAKK